MFFAIKIISKLIWGLTLSKYQTFAKQKQENRRSNCFIGEVLLINETFLMPYLFLHIVQIVAILCGTPVLKAF